MRYFGKKSLSSVVSLILHVAWYLALVASAAAVVAGVVIVFHAQLGSPFAAGLAGSSAKDIQQWETFQKLPLGVRVLILPYFGAVIALLLTVIRKSRRLFSNFKKDIVFDISNVRIIRAISKLVIALSIITFSLGSLLVGVILLLLCELIKRGAVLQEEHDLTV